MSEAEAANQILWCVAHTLGNTSPKSNNKKVTAPTLIKKTDRKLRSKPRIQSSNKKLENKMIPIFTKLLEISMLANKVFGCSSKVTMRRKAGCLFDLSILISLKVKEKKATSAPARRNDKEKSIRIRKISAPVVAAVIAIMEKEKKPLAESRSKTIGLSI